MKVAEKETTRQKFMSAVSVANAVNTKVYPKTKLALYCKEFLDANEKVIEKHNDHVKEKTKKLERELRNFKIMHAFEKDGAVEMDSEGNYKFSKESMVKVAEKTDEINEQIEKILGEVMQEKIKVKYLDHKVTLPKDIEPAIEQILQGFVYTNQKETID